MNPPVAPDFVALLRTMVEKGMDFIIVRVQVLDLQTLIKVKEEVGHDKDKAMLPILRRTLKESSRK